MVIFANGTVIQLSKDENLVILNYFFSFFLVLEPIIICEELHSDSWSKICGFYLSNYHLCMKSY